MATLEARSERWFAGPPRPDAGAPVSRARWPLAALLVLLAVSGAFLFYLSRGTTFWFDEWQWIVYRRGAAPSTFLTPHNGHFSLVPIAIYKLLLATVGLKHYAPYRLVVILAHLACAALVFVYARRRVGDALGLLGATLVVLFAAAWQDILWPFQMAWLISIATGIAALIALDRHDRRGDLAAAGLVSVSVASSGVGVAIAIAVAAEVLWGRRVLRDLWIIAVPALLYGIWWIAYAQSTPTSPLHEVPSFVANEASASLAGLVGAPSPRPTVGGSGDLLSIGRPLAALALGLVIWRLIRLRRVPVRVLSLLLGLASFWILTGVTRASLLNGTLAWASRYLYVGGVLCLLLGVELCRGASVPRPLIALVAVGVALAGASDVRTFRNAAFDLRVYGAMTRADLGAVEIAREVVAPSYILRFLPGAPFVPVRADAYRAAAAAYGTPADSPQQIGAEPPAARLVADQELVVMERARLAPAPPHQRTRRCLSAGGTSTRHARLTIPLAPAGLLVQSGAGRSTASVRRFADTFIFVGRLAPRRRGVLRIGPDASDRPWQVLVDGSRRVTVCSLGGRGS